MSRIKWKKSTSEIRVIQILKRKGHVSHSLFRKLARAVFYLTLSHRRKQQQRNNRLRLYVKNRHCIFKSKFLLCLLILFFRFSASFSDFVPWIYASSYVSGYCLSLSFSDSVIFFGSGRDCSWRTLINDSTFCWRCACCYQRVSPLSSSFHSISFLLQFAFLDLILLFFFLEFLFYFSRLMIWCICCSLSWLFFVLFCFWWWFRLIVISRMEI